MVAARKLTQEERAAVDRGDFQVPRWPRLLATRAPSNLTPKWYPLIPHPEQLRLLESQARFKIVAAGRRSGKSERAKRKLVALALGPQAYDDGLYVAAAPQRVQAKRIYWENLKSLVPAWARDRTRGKSGISESELTIYLVNGARIMVAGLDNFRAIEGVSIDFIILDEYATMKPEAWTSTVRPCLSGIGRPGSAWFVGRPKGKNHFYDLVKNFGLPEEQTDWDYFHWKSTEILDPVEIASAMNDLDSLTFAQEYLAEFVTFEGRIYYEFRREVHASLPVRYDPNRPLVLCFDFNVAPGVCAYVQDQHREPINGKDYWLRLDYDGDSFRFDPDFTAVIGEVWIPNNSTTKAVCKRIIADWGPGGRYAHHQGEVWIYGDATGGSRGSAKTEGTDWTIIREMLKPIFGGRFKDRVARSNPFERKRVVAVNSRLCSASNRVKMLVDPTRAPHVAQDLEDVTGKEDGSGEIDKDASSVLTHISDALGYFIVKRHPARSGGGLRSVSLG